MTDDIRPVVDDLEAALRLWATRDDSKPNRDVRGAATTAVEAIDTLIAELHHLRARLLSESRQADDAADRRVDALLARCHAERQGGEQ